MPKREYATEDKTYGYCGAVFEKMFSQASTIEGELVWRGRIVALCDELGIPRGSYARVTNKLREMGCIGLTVRGYRGNSLSEYTLHFPPTAERWYSLADRPRERLTAAPGYDKLAAAVEDMRKQLGGLNIQEALYNIEKRVSALEQLLKK